MSSKRGSILPGIIIGSLSLVFIIAITVGWNLIFPFYFLQAYSEDDPTGSKAGFWIIMGVGDLFLAMVMLAQAFFLTSTIRRGLHINRQTTLIDTITHELKTPLTSLLLSIETFDRRQLQEEQRQKLLGRMREDVLRLRNFIQHVIEINRIEHGQQDLRLETCDLNVLIPDCRKRICERYEIDEDTITISIPEQCFIQADRIAFESIILNLFDNAIKYSNDPYEIRAEIEEGNSALIIRVKDKGRGMSTRDIKRIFKRFTQLDRDATNSGSGLGLYLVQQLTKRMNMHIEAESDGIGHGSCFSICIPKLNT